MGAVTLERVPVAGTPRTATLEIGRRYVALVRDVAEGRWLADVVTGLVDPPPGVTVRRHGPVRLVPADGGLLPHLTVSRNLVRAHRAARSRVPRAMAGTVCGVLAKQCGLSDVLQRHPHQITHGRRRLAGVARALCGDATAIVLEDAAGYPTWGALLRSDHNPPLLGTALLLVTTDRGRADGFAELADA
jgi:ABC-type taurine transport system ATPase subunit